MNYLDHICTDGTHKITYQGYPIILVGTTDLNRVFHPFGTMLTRYEKTKDFEFMFQTVKDLANKIFVPESVIKDYEKIGSKIIPNPNILNKIEKVIGRVRD